MTGNQEHGSSSTLAQTALVGVATAADLAINFPTWIIAKRLGAGLTLPRLSEMYKGSGTVWSAYFPTVACEERFSHSLTSAVGAMVPSLGHQGKELAACAAAGAISGLVVAAPVENLVTRAHATEVSLGDALRTSLQRGGLFGTLCPYGQAMMVGREIPFSIGVFFLRDHIAQWCHKRLGRDSSFQYWSGELASSMACATIVNIPAHPPSVVLAWQQAREVCLSDALRQIYSKSGLRGFYKGFVSRSISIGGAMFVVPTVLAYDQAFKDIYSTPIFTKLAGSFTGELMSV
mmetsp:Transcript_114674/g.180528  ORF Transcript_114674/g.180528 Transcript_114674/m.180528 type:complete len:290 (-) Transcript_114674:97-966(-)|eukprot:CAMPEP_0169199638 /NCGR_PEP_ID=MMETSP1016-20121227/9444_1 /TAXON_ID=342587 /ORGANISM="Karlodinium micrum, Strain CCMP2283" /LENGTH=289 /DNA_ID=CAMNT_0009276437 /DNA_START=74 /DNA_END=943 /DNA_ORIENTATION=+